MSQVSVSIDTMYFFFVHELVDSCLQVIYVLLLNENARAQTYASDLYSTYSIAIYLYKLRYATSKARLTVLSLNSFISIISTN